MKDLRTLNPIVARCIIDADNDRLKAEKYFRTTGSGEKKYWTRQRALEKAAARFAKGHSIAEIVTQARLQLNEPAPPWDEVVVDVQSPKKDSDRPLVTPKKPKASKKKKRKAKKSSPKSKPISFSISKIIDLLEADVDADQVGASARKTVVVSSAKPRYSSVTAGGRRSAVVDVIDSLAGCPDCNKTVSVNLKYKKLDTHMKPDGSDWCTQQTPLTFNIVSTHSQNWSDPKKEGQKRDSVRKRPTYVEYPVGTRSSVYAYLVGSPGSGKRA